MFTWLVLLFFLRIFLLLNARFRGRQTPLRRWARHPGLPRRGPESSGKELQPSSEARIFSQSRNRESHLERNADAIQTRPFPGVPETGRPGPAVRRGTGGGGQVPRRYSAARHPRPREERLFLTHVLCLLTDPIRCSITFPHYFFGFQTQGRGKT